MSVVVEFRSRLYSLEADTQLAACLHCVYNCTGTTVYSLSYNSSVRHLAGELFIILQLNVYSKYLSVVSVVGGQV